MRKIVAIVLLLLFSFSVAQAMGSHPPKEEPKYKLEILKMEVVPSTTPKTLESVSKKGEPKYKLEILKMDFVPAGTVSPETKNVTKGKKK